MVDLTTSIGSLYGVGPKIAAKLAKLGLLTVFDLLYYYPRRYEDFSHPRTISQLEVGYEQIIQGRIVTIENELSVKQKMKLTRALVADGTGQLGIVWFNQPFLVRVLKPGTTWLMAGKVERGYQGEITMVAPTLEREGVIIPLYGETVGLTSKMIRKLLSELRHLVSMLPDWLPEPIRKEQQLVALGEALRMIHFPEAINELGTAKKRLAFDELLLLMLKILETKKELNQAHSLVCKIQIEEIKKIIASLPFQLTEGQRLAIWEIVQDLARSTPMNRLLEGDVGSGKTVVGAIAVYDVAKSGYRSVWMAPTEILANQHYQTTQRFLQPFGVKVGLLTASTSKKVVEQLDSFDLVVGTQALIQNKVRFSKLGLVIIDEQHRFGVNQRGYLLKNQKETPHFLAMTATPIPRTLALTLYGDLDISRLAMVPTGRKPIVTRFVDPANRTEAYKFIGSQIESGRQVFVVCPIITATGDLAEGDQLQLTLEERKSVTSEYEKLKTKVFPNLRIGLLHGRLPAKEKLAVINTFREGNVDLLVSTSVIEVGIDIPNASVMMIEGAERFGLAQLHQFRGRIGRGEHQSYCFVFTDSTEQTVFERLAAFADTTDGFEIAELDLQLRGPGQLAGLAQSGLTELKLAKISDIALIRRVKQVAQRLVEEGLANYPLLQGRVNDERRTEHLA